MFYIIALLIILASFAGLFYIFIRRARCVFQPGVGGERACQKENQRAQKREHSFSEDVFRALAYLAGKLSRVFGNKDDFFLFTEKFFRKIRLLALKLESSLNSLTQKLHQKNTERKRVADAETEVSTVKNGRRNSSAYFKDIKKSISKK